MAGHTEALYQANAIIVIDHHRDHMVLFTLLITPLPLALGEGKRSALLNGHRMNGSVAAASDPLIRLL